MLFLSLKDKTFGSLFKSIMPNALIFIIDGKIRSMKSKVSVNIENLSELKL